MTRRADLDGSGAGACDCDGVGQSVGLPDFVDAELVGSRALEASRTWGEDRPAVNLPHADDASRARGTDEPQRGGASIRSGGGSRRRQGAQSREKDREGAPSSWSSRSSRSAHSRGMQPAAKRRASSHTLTWAEKRELKERRAQKRAEADEQERLRDPMAHAREIVLTQLTSAPRSRTQLERKLADRGVEPEVAEAVLDRMEDVGLVNDAELAGMIVRSQVSGRGLARRALRQELQKKGITGEVAENALETVDDRVERQRARELVDKKLRTMSRLDDVTKKRRLAGLLARKGYCGALVWSVINEALGEREVIDDEVIDD